MHASNNQQKNKKEQKSLVQDWIDRSHQNAIRMSQDEEYRQMVASRATNWGKGIQEKSEARIRRRQSQHLEII